MACVIAVACIQALAGQRIAPVAPGAARPVAGRVALGKAVPKAPAAPIPFVATFRAAHRALGVERTGAHGFEYMVRPSTSQKEVRAMLHGLSETRQLEAASSVLSAYLATNTMGTSASQSTSKAADGNRAQTEGERLVSIVLNACAEQDRMDLTPLLLRLMRDRGVPLSSLTFCILIKGHGRAGDLPRVRKLHAATVKRAIGLDAPAFNALIDAYATHGDFEAAERTLAEMSSHTIAPSARTFNILMHGYAQHGQLHKAFEVAVRLREALGSGAANQITYATLIHACVNQNQLRTARLLLASVERGACHSSPHQSTHPLSPRSRAFRRFRRFPASSVRRQPQTASCDRR